MIARRLGRSVVLLERGKHPRFAIGESSTPLANLLLEELSDPLQSSEPQAAIEVGHLAKNVPQFACGLKRGFTFYHHRVRPTGRRQIRTPRPTPGGRQPPRRDRGHSLVSRRCRLVSCSRSPKPRRRLSGRCPLAHRLRTKRQPETRRRAARQPVASPARFRGRRHRTTRFLHRALALHELPSSGFPANASAVHALSRRRPSRSRKRRNPAVPSRRLPRCITCSTAAGSGCCVSITDSRARA